MAAPTSAEPSAVTARPATPLGGLVVAAAVPLVFLDVALQPEWSVGVGGTSVSLALSDVAVLAVAAAALAVGARDGFAPLAAARRLWLATGVFLAYLFVASAYPRAWDAHYASFTHLVTAAKFSEYALLAPAAVLLLRRRLDAGVLLAAFVGWSVVCTVVGLVQYAGVHVLHAWPAGDRQPSLLGIHEFGGYSGAAFALGLLLLAWRQPERAARPLAGVALVSGAVGVVLSGANAAGIGVAAAALALALVGLRRGTLSLRRVAAGGAAVCLVALGLLAMRAGDIGNFAHFAGVRKHDTGAQKNVQTYSQRALMAYVGYRMWLHRPVLGIGWQAVRETQAYTPYLAAAHRRFPDQPAQAFPSPQHPYGIDDAYLQALAELGVVGLAVFLAFLAAALLTGARAALRGPPEPAFLAAVGVAWVLVIMGIWTGQGLVAGTPYDAVAWLGVGLAAAGAAGARARA